MDEREVVRLFLLRKIAEEGRVTVEELDRNLTAPEGWMALVALAGDGLIRAQGTTVTITDLGREDAALLPTIRRSLV